MTTKNAVNPYIFFNGRCAEAIDFYCKNIGAEMLMKMHYKDAPAEVQGGECFPKDTANQVMHARLSVGDTMFMLSDGPCTGKYDGFALSYAATTPGDAEKAFKALSEGGKVEQPLAKTFFSPAFGMLTDRFGVKWMVIVQAPM